MKALLISLLFLFNHSFTSQNFNSVSCTFVTSIVESNYQCTGSWMPDLDVCWGNGGTYCYVTIWNNSSTEDLIVDLDSPGGTYTNETIDPLDYKPFVLSPFKDWVDLDFSSSAHSLTCRSRFYMDCL